MLGRILQCLLIGLPTADLPACLLCELRVFKPRKLPGSYMSSLQRTHSELLVQRSMFAGVHLQGVHMRHCATSLMPKTLLSTSATVKNSKGWLHHMWMERRLRKARSRRSSRISVTSRGGCSSSETRILQRPAVAPHAADVCACSVPGCSHVTAPRGIYPSEGTIFRRQPVERSPHPVKLAASSIKLL